MSTYQPPGGQQPQGPTPYTAPQDPWAGGYEQGIASVPTDPIPQQYGQFGPQGSEVWSQPTVPHGGQYPYVEQKRSRAGLLTVIFLTVLVLGGGGGYATYYLVKNRAGGLTAGHPATTGATTAGTANSWDPQKVKTGDCVVNRGTGSKVDIQFTDCGTADSFTVVKVVTGASIPEGPSGQFDGSTSLAECGDTASQNWYGYQDDTDDGKDVFLCLARNGVTAKAS